MSCRREQFSSTSDAGFVLKPPQAKGNGKKDEGKGKKDDGKGKKDNGKGKKDGVDHLVKNASELPR